MTSKRMMTVIAGETTTHARRGGRRSDFFCSKIMPTGLGEGTPTTPQGEDLNEVAFIVKRKPTTPWGRMRKI